MTGHSSIARDRPDRRWSCGSPVGGMRVLTAGAAFNARRVAAARSEVLCTNFVVDHPHSSPWTAQQSQAHSLCKRQPPHHGSRLQAPQSARATTDGSESRRAWGGPKSRFRLAPQDAARLDTRPPSDLSTRQPLTDRPDTAKGNPARRGH